MTADAHADVRMRILVVEDEYFIADDLSQALGQAGIEVVGPVGEPAEALVLVERERLDGAVLDINLHGEMIFEVAGALQRKGLPFVFATGYASSMVPPAFAAVPRFEKPFDAIALARFVRESFAR